MGYIEIPSFVSGSTSLWDADTNIWETNTNAFGDEMESITLNPIASITTHSSTAGVFTQVPASIFVGFTWEGLASYDWEGSVKDWEDWY